MRFPFALLLLFFGCFVGPPAMAQTAIYLPAPISPAYICNNAPVSIPFTAVGTYNPGNVFTAQLSDASGSFAAPITLGTLASTGSGTISGMYPSSLPLGYAYKIRVVASNPYVVGNSNNANLVHNPDTATAAIVATPNPVCEGHQVTISTATNVAGNGSYALRVKFYWQNYWTTYASGTSPGVSLMYTPQGPDSFYFTVTANTACVPATTATTAPIGIAINPAGTSAVSITSSMNGICPGTPVLFAANPINAGGNPLYEWLVNGQPAGSNADTFSSATLADNDVVQVVMTPVSVCVYPFSDTDSVVMTVYPVLAPFVSISALPGTLIAAGQQVTFTAATIHAGSSPLYQWRRNGMDIPGATGATYITDTLSDNDTITVKLTSDEHCPDPDTAVSNPIVIHVLSGVEFGTTGAASLRLYPNPSSGSFQLRATWPAACIGKGATIAVTNELGQVVYHEDVTLDKAVWGHAVVLGAGIGRGVYLVRLASENGQWQRTVVVQE